MCGITGFLAEVSEESALRPLLERMTLSLSHRGPDAQGLFVDPKVGLGLGHRRLAILDLSKEGAQPMASANNRFVLTYNGEVYNFMELRAELESMGIRFRGHSDTEIMLAAFERWGVVDSLRRFVGMFAFAVWDVRERILTLARDRLGEKPLYFGILGRAFVFASELKALSTFPGWRGELDRDALAAYMRLNYVPAPSSIYRGIRKLLPGSYLEVRPGAAILPEPQSYWSALAIAENGLAASYTGSFEEASQELEHLLKKSVKGQMVSDVPLGAFLSGGIDSSTIVALMQSQSNRPIKTFTIGFREAEFDESPFARAVAKHLGTEHTELFVDWDQALALIPRLPAVYDEPFGDSSQIPTFLVSSLTRNHVTVSLSGDGADELFCGYSRYGLGRVLEKSFAILPWPLRRGIAGLANSSAGGILGKALRPIAHLLPAGVGKGNVQDKLKKLAGFFASRDLMESYGRIMSHWDRPDSLVKGAANFDFPGIGGSGLPNGVPGLMCLDMMTYLPDDILVKVDRSSMAVSLESRTPFLDHRLVEFCWSLPMQFKVHKGQGKRILRDVLYRHAPRSLFERPKGGFSIPLAAWLRGPLRDWAENLLDRDRLRQEGILDAGLVRQCWHEHVSGVRNWQFKLWNVLMFQAWQEHWVQREPTIGGLP